MKPPEEFFEDLEKLTSHFDWTVMALGGKDEEDASKSKVMAAEFREFEQKWKRQLAEEEKGAEFRKAMDTMRKCIKELESRLEEIHLKHLLKVIEARKEWLVAESFLKATVAITVLRREMPEHLRAEFEETIRDRETGESFNAEMHYRGCEQRIVETEADYRKALAGFEVDWPERVSAALRERLEKLDAENAKHWEAEISSKLGIMP